MHQIPYVGPPDPSGADTSICVDQDKEVVPIGYSLNHLVKSTPKAIISTGALVEGGSIAYNGRHTLRFPFKSDVNHQ